MSFWNRLFATNTSRPADLTAPLRVETLEDRSVPAVLDLTAAGSSGVLNGARFSQFDGRTVERGALDTFLRMNDGGKTLQGYNSNARATQFDEVSNRTLNHALKIDDLPQVTVGGVKYRQLVLDVEQPWYSPSVSLDELRLYVSNSPTLKGYQKGTGKLGGLTAVYDMDAGGDNWVRLNARRNGNNDRGDMLLLVPEAVLGGGSYLTVYSKFGANTSARFGDVSWSYGKNGAVGDFPPPPQNTGSISGVVFQDFNNNGAWDTDEPAAVDGYVVWLDTNNDGVRDETEQSTTTDANGAYHFENLAAGATYNVRALNHAGVPTDPRFIFVGSGDAVDGVDLGVFVPMS